MTRRDVIATKISPKKQESANQDRRGGRRISKVQLCLYQLTQVTGEEIVKFSDGQALTLNTSQGGLLLLMPQPPAQKQVFEVHSSIAIGEKRSVKLVETCWMRELAFGTVGKVYLVGVRSLFEPARFH